MSLAKWSLSLGRIAGVRLRLHWTFLILVLWIFIAYYRVSYNLGDATTGVLFILAIFGCVILHELGHALMAGRFGVVTRDILLLPIGGVASMDNIPEKPGQELLIALAGPAVNLVISIVLFTYLKLSGQMPSLEGLFGLGLGIDLTSAGNQFLFNVMFANIILAVFNLVPAFPMDGGRVLRAALAFSMSHVRATTIAARMGQVLAVVFVFLGFYGNFMLVFIGLFIFLGAAAEDSQEKSKHFLAGYGVKDALMKKFTMLAPNDTLGIAVKALLNSQETEFLVGEGNNVVGVLTRNALIKALSESGNEAKVSAAMEKGYVRLNADQKIHDAQNKLLASGLALAPVFEKNQLLGVVDLTNVSELMLVNKALKSG